MQFARSIQHVIKLVSGLHLAFWPHIRFHLPTASCSPWIFFILDSGHLPTAILSVWLLILPLAIALLTVVVVVVVVVVVAPIVLSSFSSAKTLVAHLRLWSPWCFDDTSNSELDGNRRIGDSKLVGHLH